MYPVPTPPPQPSVEALLERIGTEFAYLSKQLKTIARYVEHHHDVIGLEKIENVARRCSVQPSSVVRFAKHFGFNGYRDFKAVFRDGVTQTSAPSPVYQHRIRSLQDATPQLLRSADVTHAFLDDALAGIKELQRDLNGSALDDAVALMAASPTLWVTGARRTFPVAAYLGYALQHTNKPIQLLTHLGAMPEGQLRGLHANDVMLAISFAPYAEETLTAAQIAVTRGARLIAITDSRMSPLAQEAEVLLLVHESSTFGFRALTNAMALAQGLFIALAYRLEMPADLAAHAVMS